MEGNGREVSFHQTGWFIVQNNGLLLLNSTHSLPYWMDIQDFFPRFIRHFSLGTVENTAYFCAELDEKTVFPFHFVHVPLKKALALLPVPLYGMGVKAHSVINWDKHHHHCGCCGLPTVHQGKGFERICFACGLHFFPRISPSIIVLIYKKDQVIMARGPHFLPGVYGLIAGFVEAGESLEEAVHREVKEEIGLAIKNVSYFGSQPWPFPDSLMMAFTAEYAGGEIVIDNDEIEEAGWYPYDRLPGRPSTSMSIAALMLDHFIYRCQNK